MWYQPQPNPGCSLPERRGQQFGPLIVVKVDDEWQVDHWPTGARVWPNAYALPIGYMTARRIASTLRNHPVFDRKNIALYWEHDGTGWRSRCPQATKPVLQQLKTLL